VAVDEEQKLGNVGERLSAGTFLARYESFRYIETRSRMKMTDTSLSLALTKERPLATRHSLALTGEGPVLTGTASQTEIDVTCSKQTTEKFLTGARTHIKETRICAKMTAQMNPQMSQTR
jgi:hypothetical protein